MALTLIAVGQPIFTEDTWWHLSMGRAYASVGPWLSADPNLFTAIGPPAPAAWLASLSLHGIQSLFGFYGLRVAHVAVVASIVLLAWSTLYRTSRSASYASIATAAFTALAAYRLFQLRPELVSVLATLVLARLILRPNLSIPPAERGNKGNKTFWVAILMVFWANAHAGFLLGPVLLGACIGGAIVLPRLFGAISAQPASRVRGLACMLVVGFGATLLNPDAFGPHSLLFVAGTDTPDLTVVADEWKRINLFALPSANLPPSQLSWLIVWAIVAATPMIFVAFLLSNRRAEQASGSRPAAVSVDPALIAMTCVALVAMLAAVRFLWLGFFPLLLLGACARELGWLGGDNRRVPRTLCAIAVSCAIAYGYWAYGAWPMISKAVHKDTYSHPYTTAKNNAHSVWFLSDAGLEGNLYNDYASGNFLGYWLAPRIGTFINGSLNVPREIMDASFTVGRRSWDSNEPFEVLLDRLEIDIFFATGTARVPLPGRPVVSTTTHLERTPGWLLVFRSLSSAVYLRDNPRNRENLERVVNYYADAGVPFDARHGGFDTERVIVEAPDWAVQNGLRPKDFRELGRATRVADPTRRIAASERMAGYLATIGLYERAAAIDRDTFGRYPGAVRAGRRLIWSLLHLRRFEDAAAVAARLDTMAAQDDGVSRMLIDSARYLPSLAKPQQSSLISGLSAYTRSQARQFGIGIVEPEFRRH